MKSTFFRIARLSAVITLLLVVQNGFSQSFPPTTAEKKIKFFNQGGYVAKFQIQYGVKLPDGNMSATNVSTKNLSVGQSETLTLPKGTYYLTVTGWTLDLSGKTDKTILEKNYDPNKVPGCFKSYGTLFDPKWNNNCN